MPEAIEVVLVSEEYPSDKYLDFVRQETLRALQPFVRKAIADGTPIPFTTPAGARYFLKNVGTDDLLKMKRTKGVCIELLSRPAVREEYRKDAVDLLAKLEKKSQVQVLLDAIHVQDDRSTPGDSSVLFDLVHSLIEHGAAELKTMRGGLEKLAAAGKQDVTRQLGFVALIAADGSVEPAWAMAVKSLRGLQDLVAAMPLLGDPNQRADLYPKVLPLLTALPKGLASQGEKAASLGRYVRIELPGRSRTLTLAEVEVESGGRNVAREGKARQSSTAFGGEASRGIDGNTHGEYSHGGSTHTRENSANPWWEVDLGQEFPIESITVYNRTDGNFGTRLHGFTLKVLDADHKLVYEKRDLPAPKVKAEYKIGGAASELSLRQGVMKALTSVRGKETATFKALEKFLGERAQRQRAIEAIARIPLALLAQGRRPALVGHSAGVYPHGPRQASGPSPPPSTPCKWPTRSPHCCRGPMPRPSARSWANWACG